jgi:hypothetical protein
LPNHTEKATLQRLFFTFGPQTFISFLAGINAKAGRFQVALFSPVLPAPGRGI